MPDRKIAVAGIGYAESFNVACKILTRDQFGSG